MSLETNYNKNIAMREEKPGKHISRRDFIKRANGVVATMIGATALSGCGSKEDSKTTSATAKTNGKKGTMTLRTTPTTGDKVSLLGYGCLRWFSVTDKDTGEIDQEGVNKLVDYAIEHGLNYFDTAPSYCDGKCERVTGIALNRHPRDKFFIAAKISNFSPDQWSREATLAMYHNSFKELQMDYIDYLLLHGVGMGNGIEEFENRFIKNGVLDYLLEERKKGRIRNLGFSFHGDVKVYDHLMSMHDSGQCRWDMAQIQLNYVDWKHAQEEHPRNINADYLYGELEKRNIPAVIMEPLLGGRLANVPDHIALELKQRDPEKSVASWAFRFAGTRPGILSVLSGMPYMEHLKENIETFSPLEPLNEEDMAFLESTAQKILRYPIIPCNDCKYCMPCPYGIDIPKIISHFNKCINEGSMPLTTQDPAYKSARRAFLIGYDRSVPKLRQADHCIGCNQCVDLCPQRINIPRQMQRINRFVEDLKQEREFDTTTYIWSR